MSDFAGPLPRGRGFAGPLPGWFIAHDRETVGKRNPAGSPIDVRAEHVDALVGYGEKGGSTLYVQGSYLHVVEDIGEVRRLIYQAEDRARRDRP